MTRFYFKLLVQLPPGSPEPMSYLDALYEAGCDDTTIGIGDTSLQIHFTRDGVDLFAVVAEAEAAVRHTIPGARIKWQWDHEMEECDRENPLPATAQSDAADSDPIDEIVERGIRAIEEGRYVVVDSPEAMKRFMDRIQRRVKRRARWRALKRWLTAIGFRFRGE